MVYQEKGRWKLKLEADKMANIEGKIVYDMFKGIVSFTPADGRGNSKEVQQAKAFLAKQGYEITGEGRDKNSYCIYFVKSEGLAA